MKKKNQTNKNKAITKHKKNPNSTSFITKVQNLLKDYFTKSIDPFMHKIIGIFQIVLILQ